MRCPTACTCAGLLVLSACGAGDGAARTDPAVVDVVPATIAPITFVSLDFDDAWDSQTRILDDLSDPARGPLRATFFVNSDHVGVPKLHDLEPGRPGRRLRAGDRQP